MKGSSSIHTNDAALPMRQSLTWQAVVAASLCIGGGQVVTHAKRRIVREQTVLDLVGKQDV